MSDRAPRPRSGPLDLHQWRLWLTGLIGSRYDGLVHFAVVEPGVLMRCGQPRVRELEQIRAAHGLRTVVCARGGTRHPLRGRWFRKERAYCAQHEIALEHMPFSDAATPSGAPCWYIASRVFTVRASCARRTACGCAAGRSSGRSTSCAHSASTASAPSAGHCWTRCWRGQARKPLPAIRRDQFAFGQDLPVHGVE
jgi:hypothetical protein